MTIHELIVDPNYYETTPLALTHLLVGAGFLIIGSAVLLKENFSGFSRIFFVFCAACLMWQLSRAGLASSHHPDILLMYAHLAYAASCILVPAAFQVIVVGLQKQREYLGLIISVWLFGLIATPLVLLTPWWIKGIAQHSWGAEALWAPLGYSFLVVTLLLTIQVIQLVPSALHGLPKFSNDYRRRRRISLWSLILIFAGADYIPSMGYEFPPLSTLFIFLFALSVARVVYKYGWIDVDSELHVTQLLANASQATALIDRDGLIKYVNPALENLFNQNSDSISNLRFEDLLGSDAAIENIAYNASIEIEQQLYLRPSEFVSQGVKLAMTSQYMDIKKQSFLIQLNVIDQQNIATTSAPAVYFDELSQLPTYGSFRNLCRAILDRREQSMGVLVFQLNHYTRCLSLIGYDGLESLVRQRRSQISEAFPESQLLGHIQNNTLAALLPFELLQNLPLLEARISQLNDLELAGIDSRLGSLCGGICTVNLTKDNIDAVVLSAIQAADEAHELSAFLISRSHRNTTISANNSERIHAALLANEFELYLQPVVSLSTEQIVGFEALVRWNSPEHGLLLPSEFIAELESSIFREKFERWSLLNAYHILITLQANGFESIWLSVNLTLAESANVNTSEVVQEVFNDAPLLRKNLVLEVTERVSMLAQYEQELCKLSDMGISIAIDDFGTGYSSLSRINELPIDRLKIDRSFIRQMRRSPKAAVLVDAIFSLASQLDLSVIAEGIENQTDLDHIRSAKIDQIQGFLISEAKPLTIWLDILKRDNAWIKERISLAS